MSVLTDEELAGFERRVLCDFVLTGADDLPMSQCKLTGSPRSNEFSAEHVPVPVCILPWFEMHVDAEGVLDDVAMRLLKPWNYTRITLG